MYIENIFVVFIYIWKKC